MSDLLKQLGELQRERDASAEPDAFDRMERGEPSADAPPNADALIAPLDEAFLDRVADTVERDRTVVPMRRSRAWFVAATGIAAAAVVLLILRPGAGDRPTYEATLTGGSAFTRSMDPKDTRTFFEGDFLEIRLVPDTTPETVVSTRWWVRDDAGVRRIDPSVERSESGALRIRGAVRDTVGSVGSAEVVVAIGRRDALPEQAPATDSEGDGWQAFRFRVRIETEPSGP